MKGLVFNITEKYITATHGEDVWFKSVKETGRDPLEPFVGPGTYEDSELVAIIGACCTMVGQSIHRFLFELGRFSFKQLANRHPEFLAGYTHPKPFLLSVNDIIHVEVNKLYQHAYLPSFKYKNEASDELIIIYHSKRKLYDFMEGLIAGVSDYFNIGINTTKNIYEESGAEHCIYHMKFNT